MLRKEYFDCPVSTERLSLSTLYLKEGWRGDTVLLYSAVLQPVLRIRIRIHRIHMFLVLQDPDLDPLVRGMDPDPSIIMQK